MARARRLFLQEYFGLCNRFAALQLAFAIEKAHGHEVILDWRELDAITIAGTRAGAPGPLGRLGAFRLRDCTSATFRQLGGHRKILLRTYSGPPELLEPVLRSTIDRIGIRQVIAESIRGVFASLRGRPVVGVHIRRGDFPLLGGDSYDALSGKHPAVPLWWYERAMDALVRREPATAFYLSCSGDGREFDALTRNFEVVACAVPSPYGRREAGHESAAHPIVDLFSLACCPVMLATPLSSFSHYAVNLLGPPGWCLVPPMRVHRSDWAACRVALGGRCHEDWTRACRSGDLHERLGDGLLEVPMGPVSLDWLPVVD